MIDIKYLKTTPHKAETIDKRAIQNLRPYLENEIEFNLIHIDKKQLIDESNYIIVIIDGYENIAFYDNTNKCITDTVQPIDRDNNKLFPIQKIEIQVSYKVF